jgi:hypothetical protein
VGPAEALGGLHEDRLRKYALGISTKYMLPPRRHFKLSYTRAFVVHNAPWSIPGYMPSPAPPGSGHGPGMRMRALVVTLV